MRSRIAAVERYLRDRPGMIGIVLRDRSTGAVWRNKYAHTPAYMASTSKLAMAVTLLLQNQAGVIHLSSGDWAVMHDMLHVSSDSAADTLWFKYGASFYTSFFPRIGLASAQYLPQAGEDLIGASLDLADCFRDVERVHRQVSGVGHLVHPPGFHIEPGGVRAQQLGSRPDRGRAEPGARAVGNPRVERHAEHCHRGGADVAQPRQPGERLGASETRDYPPIRRD